MPYYVKYCLNIVNNLSGEWKQEGLLNQRTIKKK